MILGLTGFAGSGKDSTAEYLVDIHHFTRVAFADKLRELAYNINPNIVENYGVKTRRLQDIVDEHDWDYAKRNYKAVREFLQALGHGARETFGDTFWIDQALTTEALDHDNVVITDLRYLNEVETVAAHGGYVIRVHREGIGPVNDHITEQILPFDYVLHNPNEYIIGLHINIDALLRGLRLLDS